MKKAILAVAICLAFAPQVFARGGGHGGGHGGSHSSGRSHSVSHNSGGSRNSTSRSNSTGAHASHPIARHASGVAVKTLITQAVPRTKTTPAGSQGGSYNRMNTDAPNGRPVQTPVSNAAEVKKVDPALLPCPPTCVAPQISPKKIDAV